MKLFALICSLFFLNALVAQSSLSVSTIDFGDLYAGSERFADVSIRNNTGGKIYVLRVEQNPELVYKLSSDIVNPNDFATVRIQLNPIKRGPFNFNCYIYMSDHQEPLAVSVVGNVKELPKVTALSTACPDFGATPPTNEPTDLTIITVDKQTREPLAVSKVVIIRNGEPAGAWMTGRKGNFHIAIPPGYFYFLATHEGYLSKEAGVYVAADIKEITIPLSKDPEFTPEPDIPVAEIPDSSETLSIDDAIAIIDEHVASTQDTLPPVDPDLADLSMQNFETQFFKPVNIVFVVDVSSSMKQGEKMDLLKYSLNQLIHELRPVDRMGIVTYSDNAHIFQVPTLCDRKEVIAKAISELKPQGMTAGGKGIKLGYRQVMMNYDPQKANEVIIITDGAFNKDSDDYQKVVRKYAKKGVTFSVVGIQARENDAKKMTEAADFGKGRYVSISQLSDAQDKLFQEIRLASFKKAH